MSQHTACEWPLEKQSPMGEASPCFTHKPLNYRKALAQCLDSVLHTVGTEELSLEESLGRILSGGQAANVYVPPWSRSLMDGYAVRAKDVRMATLENPVVLAVIDDVPAGRSSSKCIGPGEAVRIMAGARVPDGADAVIKLEKTCAAEGLRVFILDSVGENPYIIPRGHDLSPGDRAVEGGEPVNPVTIGIMASCGIRRVRVSRKPSVAIIPTGSELVQPGKTLDPGQIYDINSHALFGLALMAGAEPVNAGIIQDKSDELLAAIKSHLDKDVILLSGGVSAGDYDIVHEALMRAGVREIFWKVRVTPGKPLFLGKRGKTLVFALPGNPVSSVVNFHLFVRPVIDKLLRKKHWGNRTAMGRIRHNRIIQPGRRKFLRGRIAGEGPELYIEVLPEQRSGLFSPMLEADVLIEVPEQIKVLKDGDAVRVHFLNG